MVQALNKQRHQRVVWGLGGLGGLVVMVVAAAGRVWRRQPRPGWYSPS